MLKCSRCQIPLCHIDYNGAHVHVCPDCRGLLVGAESLKDIARRRDAGGKEEEEGSAVHARQSERPGRIRCLAEMSDVSVKMAHDTYRVCSCSVCNVCWLDRPELQRAQNLYEKERQSRTPHDWARIERSLLAQVALREEAEQMGEGQRISEEMLPGVGLASINRWWLVARAARLLLRLVARV
jgi:Zn-finger nucleic acid-binding protein